MRLRHLVAAVLAATAIAAVYGSIAWGLFARFDDFRDHLLLAQQIHDTGRPGVPHFLFHALTALLSDVPGVPSLIVAGRLVTIGAYFLQVLVLYVVYRMAFRDSRADAPWVLGTLSAMTALAQPITTTQAYALGYLWLEPYHSPTYAMLKPFALAGFAATAWFLSQREAADGRAITLFGATTVLGALTKPSLAICLVPASVVLVTYRAWRRQPLQLRALIIGLYVPVTAVLAWQFLVTYSGLNVAERLYQNSLAWAPLKFMHYWATSLPARFAASTAFPVAVGAMYWRSARHDPMLQLAWLCFGCGALYAYTVIETAAWESGNFVWSAYISLFILFVASVIHLVRHSTTAVRGWPLARTVICGALFALHVGSGARIASLYLANRGCGLDLHQGTFDCD